MNEPANQHFIRHNFFATLHPIKLPQWEWVYNLS